MVLTTLLNISSTLSQLSLKSFNLLSTNKRILTEDPRFFAMQNLARFQTVRYWNQGQSRLAQTASSPLSLENRASVSTEHPLAEIHAMLQRDGYYQGLRLAPDLLRSLLLFSQTCPCYGNRDPKIKFLISQREQTENALGLTIKCASYFDGHESCRSFQKLKHDPTLNAIASHYLGQTPRYHRSELAWSFPRPTTQAERLASAQVLHCDINDYKTVKFFFYLTDVDVASGPHVYIKGSHLNRNLWHQLLGQRIASVADQTLIERYGNNNVTTVCGSAGFGFVGDPYVLHKGTTPHRQSRLLLQLEFGVNTYKTWYFTKP